MKTFRKWMRILHRDIGYFFIGVSLIYGISGIALNHLNDWNPNYSVEVKHFKTDLNLNKSNSLKNNISKLLDKIDDKKHYRKHYFPQDKFIKIFLDGGSSIVVNTHTGDGTFEQLTKRPIFYMVNYLHYNPNNWWMWFSDIFAGALIFLALSSLFMVKGWKGAWGRGGLYTILGIIIPLFFYFLS